MAEFNAVRDLDLITLGGIDACIKSIANNVDEITPEQRGLIWNAYDTILSAQRWIVLGETPEMQAEADTEGRLTWHGLK